MKQSLTSARRPLEALIHIIGWGIMFGFPFFFVERENGNINWMAYLRHSAVPLSFMIAFYVNYFLLVPRYLFQSQTKRYITYNILLLCVIGLMLHLWRSLTFDPSFVPKPHRSGGPSGMAVLCQRYAESRLHHRTECRHTYECPMDTSGSCP